MDSKPHGPPKWAQRLLVGFLREELAEEVQGDLEEKFFKVLHKRSPLRAKMNYWYQVFHYLRPFAFRFTLFQPSIYPDMYKNYVKVAWRNISRNKIYATIKIGGFAIGIAACLLIGLFIKDELSYDKHYPKANRIYRLINSSSDPEDPMSWTAFAAPIAKVAMQDFPEIENVGRLIPFDWYDAGANQFKPLKSDKDIYEEGFVYADQAFIDILELPMVYGTSSEALIQTRSMVISQRKAEKYFPGKNPIGELVVLNGNVENPYIIGGVMENFPTNSHLQYDFLLTLTGVEFWPGEQNSWCCSNYNPYVLVKEGADMELLEEKVQRIKTEYIVPFYQKREDPTADYIAQYQNIKLQAVGDIYLHSDGFMEAEKYSDINYVWLFGTIALFILLLACINFINLSTAKSANRAKEVGLRKVIGSNRKNLVRQFLTESLLFSTLSVGLGLLIANFALPFFNSLAGKSLELPLFEWWLFPTLLLTIGIIGILAGIYPAFYLSGFKPIQVLKGELRKGSKGSWFQNSLVVFQFTTSVILIIGAFIVHRQMQFILDKKLGYDKDQVLMIQGTNTLGEKILAFQESLKQLSDVGEVSSSNYFPVSGTKRDMNQWWKEGKTTIDKGVGAQSWNVDPNYISTLGMKMLKGRTFSLEMASDTAAIIINQAMAEELAFDGIDPLGQIITNDFQPPFRIIGVMEDFHFASMKGEIKPLCLRMGIGGSITAAKLSTPDVQKAIRSISEVWDEYMPHQSFRYTFLDERYAAMYDDVKRAEKVFATFALVAVIIACLGLFALVTYMAEQRRKEISIRKILGATVQQLFALMTSNFLKLVGISLALAVPIGYFLMNGWLEDFAYRIPISWEVFLYAGLIILLIALATMSYEALRVARLDPVQSLQDE
ncbi:MAG: FtsX-like permease family protein [Bacteroidota bacterium]